MAQHHHLIDGFHALRAHCSEACLSGGVTQVNGILSSARSIRATRELRFGHEHSVVIGRQCHDLGSVLLFRKGASFWCHLAADHPCLSSVGTSLLQSHPGLESHPIWGDTPLGSVGVDALCQWACTQASCWGGIG